VRPVNDIESTDGLAPSDEAAVLFERVTLAMGGRTVLSYADFTIEPGEFIGVLGPNGAGKTTLMRAILGLVPPLTGRIRVQGTAPARGNSGIGYMPQLRQGANFMGLNGAAFMRAAANGHRWGLPLAGQAERKDIDWALAAVGAETLADRPLAELSGGERQRLLLAQALLGRPSLLLLDEPLISLDPTHQSAVVELAQRLQREFGMTVLFSAHELNPLLGALDRVLYLGNGQAALGTVDEVITPPILSRLYGSEIDVVRLGARIFVMSREHDVEKGEHRHDA
jgi:zinc/manganese transport system ATP-binding protein